MPSIKWDFSQFLLQKPSAVANPQKQRPKLFLYVVKTSVCKLTFNRIIPLYYRKLRKLYIDIHFRSCVKNG